jgi:hypothetical protein
LDGCFSKELSEDPFYFPIKGVTQEHPQLKHMLIILSLSGPCAIEGEDSYLQKRL